MIDLSQGLILSLLVKAFFTGAFLGVLYEGVRIAKMLLGIGGGGRVRKPLSAIFLFFTDLLFCLMFAFCAMLLTYNISGGIFRCSVYFSMGVGLILYRQTVGRLTERIERVITRAIRKLIRAILRLAFIPMRAIFSLLCKLYRLTIGRIIGKIRCGITARRQRKSACAEIDPDAVALGVAAEENVDREKGTKGAGRYKKGERISFGSRERRGGSGA